MRFAAATYSGLVAVILAGCSSGGAGGALPDGGTLSDGSVLTDAATPDSLSSAPLQYVQLAVGKSQMCGLAADGVAYCWGSNYVGGVGNGTTTKALCPYAVAGLKFKQVSADNDLTCGVTIDGDAYCWGNAAYGAVGDGRIPNELTITPTPTRVVGGLKFVEAAAGENFACARTASSGTYCWGIDIYHQLGDGSTERTNSGVPVRVDTTLNFASLYAGGPNACGLLADGSAHCWGDNLRGQLGIGTYDLGYTVRAVTGGIKFKTLAVGNTLICGLSLEGAAYCWGSNLERTIATTDTSDYKMPVRVATGYTFVALTAQGHGVCGLTAAGEMYCWGTVTPFGGRLETTPKRAAEKLAVRTVAIGGNSACVLTDAGHAYCMGDLANGNGVEGYVPELTAVVGACGVGMPPTSSDGGVVTPDTGPTCSGKVCSARDSCCPSAPNCIATGGAPPYYCTALKGNAGDACTNALDCSPSAPLCVPSMSESGGLSLICTASS